MASPKVTVIMPSLNVYPYICECMDSVIHQTLQEIEIICVDAGSTDGTWETLSEYEKCDPRVHLILSEKKSYGYQVNIGLQIAHGEYIGIVETDDYIALNMYELLYQTAIDTARPDVVKSGFYRLIQQDSDIEFIPTFHIKAQTGDVFSLSDHYDILRGYPSIWSCIYKRSFLKNRHIQMQELPGAGWADNLFLYKTMCEALRIAWVDKPLYYYREFRLGSSSIIKNCSILIDRINDIKDYLDANYPGDLLLNAVAYQRAIDYQRMILEAPDHTEQNTKDAKRALSRFNRSASFLGRLMQRKITIENITHSCYQNGLLPTVHIYIQKIKHTIRRSYGK